MSDPVMALGGAAADATVTVRELASPGTVSLRGDLAVIGPVAAEIAGCAVPGRRGIAAAGAARLAWMSPDELLLMLPRADVPGALATLAERLSGQHHLALDVSDMRSHFAVTGPGVREVLAKLAPVDLHPDSFGPGEMRRTRLAQVACAFWMEGEEEIRLVCFRSVARYAFDVLRQAAADEARLSIFAPA